MIQAVNDFVVKFANINGSGSASANELFARSIMRLGVPVCPRNIFPSNIQGLPTWYEVRVSEAGYLGRRGGCDLLVAMNPQTFEADMAELVPGGYLFYDNTREVPAARFREDIQAIGLPLTQLCNEAFPDARQRHLFKNLMVVGALSALLSIEMAAAEALIREQYGHKEKLLEANTKALRLGYDLARSHLDCEGMGLKVRRSDRVSDKIFLDGNTACALGLLYGGASVCAWYPITPSTSIPESFQKYCARYRTDAETGRKNYAIVQAEDELASIGMVVGAGWNGARAFTATSGPGVSLMTEFLGLAYFAEIPVTIVNVQRGGPSTGMPSRTQQSDLFACAYASHGDTKHVLLFPEDARECFDFSAQALDLADRLQTPVFVMSDLEIGMNSHMCEPLAWNDDKKMDRGKVMTYEALEAGRDFGRYLDVDGDGIPYRTYPGTHPQRGAYFTRGTTKDPYARYSEDGAVYVANMERLTKKFETAKGLVPLPLIRRAEEATRIGVIYFGSTSPAMREALAELARQGLHLDALRVRAFPFSAAVLDFVAAHDQVFVVEQNRDGQLRKMLIIEGDLEPNRLVSVLHYDGTPITARFITQALRDKLAAQGPTILEGVRP